MILESIGAHRVWREDDVIGVQWEGSISYEDMYALRQLFRALLEEHSTAYLLTDMRRCTTLEPQARKFMLEWSREKRDKVDGTVVCGVNFTMRTLILMAMKAIRIIGHDDGHMLEFVRDEAEARRWIAARRVVVAAGKRPRAGA